MEAAWASIVALDHDERHAALCQFFGSVRVMVEGQCDLSAGTIASAAARIAAEFGSKARGIT